MKVKITMQDMEPFIEEFKSLDDAVMAYADNEYCIKIEEV